MGFGYRNNYAPDALLSLPDISEGIHTATEETIDHPTIVSARSGNIQLLVKGYTSAEQLPVWLQPTVQGFADLLALPRGWDSYDAPKIKFAAVRSALDLLVATLKPQSPGPSVVPTVQGGLQLEWHIQGIDLEIRLDSPDKVDIFCEDLHAGIEWEGSIPSDEGRLREAIAKLTG